MTKTKEEQQVYFDAQTKLQRAQTKQAESKVGSREEAEGRAEQHEALSVLSDLEYREGHREEFEPKVPLVAPNPVSHWDSTLNVEWVNGRAEGVPRSVAERLCQEFSYEIEEAS